MRLFQRVLPILTIAATVTAMLLGGGAVVLAGDHEDSHHVKVDHKGKVHIVAVDEDGEKHEEIFEFEGDGPRAFLGVHLEHADEEGVVVGKVVEDSAAERAGLQVGDVIVGIDGEATDGPFDMTRRILQAEPGDRVDIEILRDGDRRTLTAELGEREGLGAFHIAEFDTEAFERQMEQLEEQMEHLDIYIEGLDEYIDDLSIHIDEEIDIPGLKKKIIAIAGHRPLLGVQLVGPTPELREHMGADPEEGVLVSKVLKGMPAEAAGIEVGDMIVAVDAESVEDAGDLISALKGKEGETVVLDVVRDGRPMTLDVFLPERED
jgi:predicted metalloprotease with PDZ domain